MKRVIAHFLFNRRRRKLALELMKVEHETKTYVLGELSDTCIQRLERDGLIVERLEDEPEAETPGRLAEVNPGVQRRSIRDESSGTAEQPPDYSGGLGGPIDEYGPNFYLIQLRGPLLEEWRRQLDDIGVRVLSYVPRAHYTVRLSPRQARDVSELDFVSRVRLYGPQDTGPITFTRTRRAAFNPPGVDRAMVVYDLRLHRDDEEDYTSVRERLEGLGVEVVGVGRQKFRIYLLEGSPLADRIAELPEVAEMAEYVPPGLHNDRARVLLGLDTDANGSLGEVASRLLAPALTKLGINNGVRSDAHPNLLQTGEGQIVAVADAGLDDSHEDLNPRIFGVVPLGRPYDTSDPYGHGTHVAGSVLGDGSASGGRICGAAPKAGLFFQSLLDTNGELGGLPSDLGDLFEEAYQAGARIHNNSWGSATPSTYTAHDVEVDRFVATHRDMLIVMSAGNEGQAANCLYSDSGFVDHFSINSPGSCKNGLTVGASRSSRTTRGYANLTYREVWPTKFPDSPIAEQKVSGESEGVAAFSSRGPTDDSRIKPDILAPGTDIASTRSSSTPSRIFWGSYPKNKAYAFMGGTSMAAPLVSGCAALVRQYYCEEREHNPSAALLKATLINSTRWLTGDKYGDAIAGNSDLPNYHQGFGCIYLPDAIPNSLEPDLELHFLDTWDDEEQQFDGSYQASEYVFSVRGGAWLRLCLVWTDHSSRSLQNDLNLTVEHLEQKRIWVGNEHLPRDIRGPRKKDRYDHVNNVEVVRIENPPPGYYAVTIEAERLTFTEPKQDFALVVSGELSSSYWQAY